MDLTRQYRLDPQVALRPEQFGALAYHYGNRRLTFLKSKRLVQVVTHLGEHHSVDEALDASGVDGPHRDLYVRTLTRLEEAGVISAAG